MCHFAAEGMQFSDDRYAKCTDRASRFSLTIVLAQHAKAPQPYAILPLLPQALLEAPPPDLAPEFVAALQRRAGRAFPSTQQLQRQPQQPRHPHHTQQQRDVQQQQQQQPEQQHQRWQQQAKRRRRKQSPEPSAAGDSGRERRRRGTGRRQASRQASPDLSASAASDTDASSSWCPDGSHRAPRRRQSQKSEGQEADDEGGSEASDSGSEAETDGHSAELGVQSAEAAEAADLSGSAAAMSEGAEATASHSQLSDPHASGQSQGSVLDSDTAASSQQQQQQRQQLRHVESIRHSQSAGSPAVPSSHKQPQHPPAAAHPAAERAAAGSASPPWPAEQPALTPKDVFNQKAPDGRCLVELGREEAFALLAARHGSPLGSSKSVRRAWLGSLRRVAGAGLPSDHPSLHFLPDGRQARVLWSLASVHC